MLPTAKMRNPLPGRGIGSPLFASLGERIAVVLSTRPVYGRYPRRGMRLSAIIPTHNRPAELRRCLESLKKQTSGASEIEVIVVDDGSDTDIGSVVAELATMGPVAMRCERQPLTGLNSARNRGVAAASGDLLAFLDDDTLVSPGWAQAMLATFDHYPCAAVGGRVRLGLPGPPPPWLVHREAYLAEYDLGTEGRWLNEDPVPVGANCAVRRVDFERIGGFRPG